MTDIKISIEGLDRVLKAFGSLPDEIKRAIEAAGKESADDVILPEQGLKKYPPATAANQPPHPYYVRGRGTQTARGNKGESERFGTQFFTKSADWQTTIGNRASYAKYLTDEHQQARAMQRIGWKKLIDVARDKKGRIQRVYQAWIDRAISRLGL
jgi:hypothetical protein